MYMQKILFYKHMQHQGLSGKYLHESPVYSITEKNNDSACPKAVGYHTGAAAGGSTKHAR